MLDSQPQVLPILLGSGVSCAGHLPGVGLLSDAASAVFWGTTEEPLFGAIKGLCEEDRGGLPSNYEDWLYLAIQLRDHVRRDYENPGLIPFVSHLISHTNEAGLRPGEMYRQSGRVA